ncbi:MAG TPA: redoxin family protein [Gemmataceae bacterium]|jgi:thiol-disulfide isomerase/thioredoxin|nr:redoxin family protein [Gemmataceae bacterium]
MRTLLAAALAALIVAPAAFTQDKKEPPKKTEPTLKVGDPAPKFVADKWLQGGPVDRFENGKVYVVEFWATWCGPCIAMMPHLADMAEEYKAKGVTVIGFSSTAQDQIDKAEKFVGKRGPKLGYNFAWGTTDATHTAWMKAANQGGIPCSFVVNKEGKIAYIGHPLFLDIVLPQVLAGTWDPVKGAADMEAADKDFDKAYEASQNKDAAAGQKAMDEILAARPSFADVPYLLSPRLELLIKNKRFADAQKIGEKSVAKAAKRDDVSALRTVRQAFLADAAKGEKELVALAVKAAEMDREVTGADDAGATIRLASAYVAAGDEKAKKLAAEGVTLAEKALKGDKDWQGQLLLATAHDAAGDKAAAKSAGEKAVAAGGENPGLKKYILEQVKKYGVEEPKEEKKDK